MFGRSLEGVWKVSRRCLQDFWKVSRRCPDVVWKASGGYLEGVGRSLENFCMVSGRVLEGLLELLIASCQLWELLSSIILCIVMGLHLILRYL